MRLPDELRVAEDRGGAGAPRPGRLTTVERPGTIPLFDLDGTLDRLRRRVAGAVRGPRRCGGRACRLSACRSVVACAQVGINPADYLAHYDPSRAALPRRRGDGARARPVGGVLEQGALHGPAGARSGWAGRPASPCSPRTSGPPKVLDPVLLAARAAAGRRRVHRRHRPRPLVRGGGRRRFALAAGTSGPCRSRATSCCTSPPPSSTCSGRREANRGGAGLLPAREAALCTWVASPGGSPPGDKSLPGRARRPLASDPVLIAKDLVRHHGAQTVLGGVSLSITRGHPPRRRRAQRHRQVDAAADPGGRRAARRRRGRAHAGHHDRGLAAAGARRPRRARPCAPTWPGAPAWPPPAPRSTPRPPRWARTPTSIEAYSDALEHFLALGGDDLDARTGAVLAQVGLARRPARRGGGAPLGRAGGPGRARRDPAVAPGRPAPRRADQRPRLRRARPARVVRGLDAVARW